MVLPLVVSLCSASMIAGEKKSGMQNIVFLPIRLEKIWFGKTAALVILLFVTNLFLWIATTVAGMAASVTVSPFPDLFVAASRYYAVNMFHGAYESCFCIFSCERDFICCLC